MTLPGFTISRGSIQFHNIYRHFLCTVAYSVELWRVCHDPRKLVDGRAYTDSSWRVRLVGVEKIEEEVATFRSSSIFGCGA